MSCLVEDDQLRTVNQSRNLGRTFQTGGECSRISGFCWGSSRPSGVLDMILRGVAGPARTVHLEGDSQDSSSTQAGKPQQCGFTPCPHAHGTGWLLLRAGPRGAPVTGGGAVSCSPLLLHSHVTPGSFPGPAWTLTAVPWSPVSLPPGQVRSPAQESRDSTADLELKAAVSKTSCVASGKCAPGPQEGLREHVPTSL